MKEILFYVSFLFFLILHISLWNFFVVCLWVSPWPFGFNFNKNLLTCAIVPVLRRLLFLPLSPLLWYGEMGLEASQKTSIFGHIWRRSSHSFFGLYENLQFYKIIFVYGLIKYSYSLTFIWCPRAETAVLLKLKYKRNFSSIPFHNVCKLFTVEDFMFFTLVWLIIRYVMGTSKDKENALEVFMTRLENCAQFSWGYWWNEKKKTQTKMYNRRPLPATSISIEGW